MRKIILASSSPQRKLLMESLGIPFEVVPSNINEKSIRDSDFKVRAEKLARAKAEAIPQNNGEIVIAADTFNVCQGRVLEKPQTLNEAKEMLKLQSDNKATSYTGFCYLDKTKDINFSTAISIEYTFRELSNQEIDQFITANPVLTWSAAFSPAYTYQLTFIANISCSLTGFTHGLPMELLVPLLKKSGFIPHSKSV